VVKHLVSGLGKRQWEEGHQVDVHPGSQCEAALRQCTEVEHRCLVNHNLNHLVSHTQMDWDELTSRWSSSECIWRKRNPGIWRTTAWIPTSTTGWVWDATTTWAGVWARTTPSDWSGYEPRESVCPSCLFMNQADE